MSMTLPASSLVIYIIVSLCQCPVSAAQRDDLYDEKVSAPGLTAWLNCNNSTEMLSAPNDSVPVSWMLPNLTVLYGDQGRFQILHDNWTLKINNVSTGDLGLYHCMLQTPQVDWFLLRIGLNAGGPYFEDLWDKYWLNTVIGLSAFFGFLLLAFAIIIIYHFRYRPEDDELAKRHASSTFSDLAGGDQRVTVVKVVDGRVNDVFDWDTKKPPSSSNEQSSTSSSEETTVVAQTHTISDDDGQQAITQL